MALVVKERIKETTATSGTGTLTLSGAVNGFRPFSDIGNNNTTFYCISDDNNNTFEVGLGTYNANTLTRDTVFQTSSGNTTKINFASGNKEVFVTYVAEKSVHKDANGDIDTTGKIKFANVYSQTSDLPSASTYHGMFAHVHATGKGYFAHAGQWVELANASDLSSYLLSSAVSSYGATLIDDADAPTARTTLGLGSMAVETASDYLTTSSASSTYLTQSNASSTYLTQSSASSTYLTQSSASSTYAPLSGASFTGSVSISSGNAIAVGQSSFSGGSVIADFHTSGNSVGTQLAFANDHNTDKFFVGLEGNTTGNGMIYQQKDADINFYTNNNLRMTLDNNGNLILDDGNITLPQTGILSFLSASDEYIQGGSGTITLGVNNLAHLKIEDTVSTFGQSDADYTVKIGSSGYAGIYVDGSSDIAILNPAYDNVVFGANNSRTYLYYDSVSTLYTDANGIYVRSSTNYSDGTIYLGSNGSARIINDDDSYFQILSGSSDTIIFQYNNASVYLYYNGTQVIQTDPEGIYVKSTNTNTDGTVYLGNQGYAKIVGDYDNATYIYNGSNDAVVWGSNNSRTYLYHNGTSTLYTDANGIFVRSVSDAGYGVVYVGNSGYGGLYGNSGNTWLNTASNDNIIWGQNNSYTYLYYDNSWKARTRSEGFEVNGSLIVSDRVSVNNSYGTSGQVLTSQGNATAPTWTDPSGGAWEEVSSTALTGTGQSSTIRNFSVSADTLYRFTFSKFYWVGNSDMIAIKLSQDGGSSWKNMYGVKWKRQSWLTMNYSSNQAQTQDRADLQQRSISTDPKYGHWCQVYVHTLTNGGAWVWSRTFGKTNSYENNETGFRGAVYGEGGTVNYIRLQPGNYFSSSYSSQGMRGHLRVEKWST